MARRGFKASHYQQVMGEKSPLARLIRMADKDVQERVKAAQELRRIDGMDNIRIAFRGV